MTAVKDILFLTQRIPYPPDKGDKIRSFHILQHLAKDHRIHLGCFVDDPYDMRYLPELSKYCASVLCLPIVKPLALLSGAANLARGRSLSQGYFHQRRMSRWVSSAIERADIRDIFVYCSSMAPYAFPFLGGRRVVMDMVDVDSEKWRAYGAGAAWPLNVLYTREADALLALETKSVLAFDHTFLAGSTEARLLLERAPQCAGRVSDFQNGVDTAYFDPKLEFENPYSDGVQAVTFTGAMDYEPNIQAVIWFARNAFPELRRQHPQSEFWIVGSNPAPSVKTLVEVSGVRVVGRVPDMRPYLRYAACIVTPLQIARGVQNKVLEAMAMDRTVVATRQAWQGLTAVPGKELFLAETPEDFTATVSAVLEGKIEASGARQRILADHSWVRNLEILGAEFDGPAARRRAVPALP